MSKPKIRAEQLQPGYKAPTTEKGVRTQHSDGRLVTTSAFTTSAKKQERRSELRPDNTANSTGFATSVTSAEPVNTVSNLVPNSSPSGIQAPGGCMNYTAPFSLMTDDAKQAEREAIAADPSTAPTTHRLRPVRATNAQGWNYSAHSMPKRTEPTEAPPLTARQQRRKKGL